MNIGFGILLDIPAHNFIRQLQWELQQVIGIGMARQPPHVTFKSPFEASEIEPYTEYLTKLAADTPAFELNLDGFGYFGEQVLFLDVQENAILTDFHERVLQDMKTMFGISPDPYEGSNVKFPASIAGFQQDEQFQAAPRYIQRYHPNFSFRISELGLFNYLGPGQGWIISQRTEMAP